MSEKRKFKNIIDSNDQAENKVSNFPENADEVSKYDQNDVQNPSTSNNNQPQGIAPENNPAEKPGPDQLSISSFYKNVRFTSTTIDSARADHDRILNNDKIKNQLQQLKKSAYLIFSENVPYTSTPKMSDKETNNLNLAPDEGETSNLNRESRLDMKPIQTAVSKFFENMQAACSNYKSREHQGETPSSAINHAFDNISAPSSDCKNTDDSQSLCSDATKFIRPVYIDIKKLGVIRRPEYVIRYPKKHGKLLEVPHSRFVAHMQQNHIPYADGDLEQRDKSKLQNPNQELLQESNLSENFGYSKLIGRTSTAYPSYCNLNNTAEEEIKINDQTMEFFQSPKSNHSSRSDNHQNVTKSIMETYYSLENSAGWNQAMNDDQTNQSEFKSLGLIEQLHSPRVAGETDPCVKNENSIHQFSFDYDQYLDLENLENARPINQTIDYDPTILHNSFSEYFDCIQTYSGKTDQGFYLDENGVRQINPDYDPYMISTSRNQKQSNAHGLLRQDYDDYQDHVTTSTFFEDVWNCSRNLRAIDQVANKEQTIDEATDNKIFESAESFPTSNTTDRTDDYDSPITIVSDSQFRSDQESSYVQDTSQSSNNVSEYFSPRTPDQSRDLNLPPFDQLTSTPCSSNFDSRKAFSMFSPISYFDDEDLDRKLDSSAGKLSRSSTSFKQASSGEETLGNRSQIYNEPIVTASKAGRTDKGFASSNLLSGSTTLESERNSYASSSSSSDSDDDSDDESSGEALSSSSSEDTRYSRDDEKDQIGFNERASLPTPSKNTSNDEKKDQQKSKSQVTISASRDEDKEDEQGQIQAPFNSSLGEDGKEKDEQKSKKQTSCLTSPQTKRFDELLKKSNEEASSSNCNEHKEDQQEGQTEESKTMRTMASSVNESDSEPDEKFLTVSLISNSIIPPRNNDHVDEQNHVSISYKSIEPLQHPVVENGQNDINQKLNDQIPDSLAENLAEPIRNYSIWNLQPGSPVSLVDFDELVNADNCNLVSDEYEKWYLDQFDITHNLDVDQLETSKPNIDDPVDELCELFHYFILDDDIPQKNEHPKIKTEDSPKLDHENNDGILQFPDPFDPDNLDTSEHAEIFEINQNDQLSHASLDGERIKTPELDQVIAKHYGTPKTSPVIAEDIEDQPEESNSVQKDTSINQDQDYYQWINKSSSGPIIIEIADELSNLIEDDCKNQKNKQENDENSEKFDINNDGWMYQPSTAAIDEIVDELSNAVKSDQTDQPSTAETKQATEELPSEDQHQNDDDVADAENTERSNGFDIINFYNLCRSPSLIEILLEEYSSSSVYTDSDKDEGEEKSSHRNLSTRKQMSRDSSIVRIELEKTQSSSGQNQSKSQDHEKSDGQNSPSNQNEPSTSMLLPSQLLSQEDIDRIQGMFEGSKKESKSISRKSRRNKRLATSKNERPKKKTEEENRPQDPRLIRQKYKRHKYFNDNRPRKRARLDGSKKRKIVLKPRALMCPLVSEYFYNVENSGVDEAEVQFTASYRGFRPTCSSKYPHAVAMRTKVLHVGRGSHNDVNLEIFGFCNYISSLHAIVWFNDNSRAYELLNYSPFGTMVNDEVYGINVKVERKSKNKKRLREKKPRAEKLYCKILREPFGEDDSRRRCFCDPECIVNVTEEPVRVEHGSVLSFGCIPFVFSLLRCANE